MKFIFLFLTALVLANIGGCVAQSKTAVRASEKLTGNYSLPARISNESYISEKSAFSQIKTQTKGCGKTDEKKLLKITQKAHPFSSWEGIYKTYSQFSQCDDGLFAEKFSSEVVYLLASKWNTLNALNTIVSKDKGFEEFVIKHINSTADEDELKKVVENSKSECQKSRQQLCSKIHGAASAALQS